MGRIIQLGFSCLSSSFFDRFLFLRICNAGLKTGRVVVYWGSRVYELLGYFGDVGRDY
jgi:hypothetical protein